MSAAKDDRYTYGTVSKPSIMDMATMRNYKATSVKFNLVRVCVVCAPPTKKEHYSNNEYETINSFYTTIGSSTE